MGRHGICLAADMRSQNISAVAVVVTLASLVIACSSGGAGTISNDGDGGAEGGGGTDGGGRDGGRVDATDNDAAREGGSGGCSANAQCRPGFENCVAPGQPVCGGPAPLKECNVDGDCADAGTDQVCIAEACGGASCGPKCTADSECTSAPAGLLMCGGNGHCAVKPCTSTSCPTNFTCSGNQGCVRKACTADGECSGGACVNAQCWSGRGTCEPMPS